MSSRSHRWADRFAFALLVGGVLLLVQPWWKAGFQLGFWVTLGAIVLVNVTARLATDDA